MRPGSNTRQKKCWPALSLSQSRRMSIDLDFFGRTEEVARPIAHSLSTNRREGDCWGWKMGCELGELVAKTTQATFSPSFSNPISTISTRINFTQQDPCQSPTTDKHHQLSHHRLTPTLLPHTTIQNHQNRPTSTTWSPACLTLT